MRIEYTIHTYIICVYMSVYQMNNYSSIINNRVAQRGVARVYQDVRRGGGGVCKDNFYLWKSV